MSRRAVGGAAAACLGLLLAPRDAPGQENYEIQVYAYDTVEPGATMVESHTNLTLRGHREVSEGVAPTHHALHETIEVTHGFTPWFELGFYLFTSVQPGSGWNWVGDHIRPRVRAPESWRWPVGVSLSAECGYQRRSFATENWSCELRPIVDGKWGRFYAAFNPTVERALSGPAQRVELSPNLKVSYDVTRQLTAGLEYYGALGPAGHIDALARQQHQIFPTLDLNVSPRWELNVGVGFGLTHATDGLILKTIVGRRFGR